MLHVCCWAHARRKFVAASEAKDERAEVALGLIRQLDVLERDLPALLLPADDPPVTSGSSGYAAVTARPSSRSAWDGHPPNTSPDRSAT